ncbi:MAG: RraA family protein [Planctomycetales bacterium]|nr:RraA family protein [Planctomycetales bacterium]
MAHAATLLEKLAKYDSPTICNVIELFNVIPRNQGYMDARIRCCFPEMPPMVGYATTASFRSDAPAVGGAGYGSLDQQIERFAALPGPAILVFQDLDDPAVAAVFGEVMCSSYRAFGAVGLVTNGAGRDLTQVQRLGFPVFTGSTIVSHGYSQIMYLGMPVRVGGIVVHEGTLLHGDENGVTTIPIEIADEVADVADEYIAAEEVVIGYAKSDGDKSVPEYRERLAELKHRIEALQARLRRA